MALRKFVTYESPFTYVFNLQMVTLVHYIDL